VRCEQEYNSIVTFGFEVLLHLSHGQSPIHGMPGDGF